MSCFNFCMCTLDIGVRHFVFYNKQIAFNDCDFDLQQNSIEIIF